MSLSKLWELVMDGKAWCAAVHGLQRVGHDWVTEEQPRSRGPCPAEGLGMPSCLFPTWGPCPTCQVPLQLHPPVLPKSDVLFTRLPLYRQHCPPSPPHTHTHRHTHTLAFLQQHRETWMQLTRAVPLPGPLHQALHQARAGIVASLISVFQEPSPGLEQAEQTADNCWLTRRKEINGRKRSQYLSSPHSSYFR